jgi:hypothetical protein
VQKLTGRCAVPAPFGAQCRELGLDLLGAQSGYSGLGHPLPEAGTSATLNFLAKLDLLLQERCGATLTGAVFMQSQKLIDAHPEELREGWAASRRPAGRARATS